MEALYLLIPLSLIALGGAIWVFLRMNASGQFDDTEGPAYSILLDDDDPTRGRRDPEVRADTDEPVSDRDRERP